MGSTQLIERSRASSCPDTAARGALAWQVAWVAIWLLPNWLLRIATRDLYAPRGLFTIDLFLFGAIALFLRPIWTPVLLDFAIAVDVLEGILHTWFFSLGDLVPLTHSLFSLPGRRVSFYTIDGCVVFGGFAWAAWRVRRKLAHRLQVHTAIPLVLFAVLCVTIDSAWGGRNWFRLHDSQSTIQFARIPERSLIQQIYGMINPAPESDSDSLVDSASAHMLENLPPLTAGQRPDIVQIVVESWGTDKTAILDQKLLSLYAAPAIRNHYRLVLGSVPFHGSTIFGEVRELCNTNMGFGVLRVRSAASLRNCLPSKLRALGYRTEGVHGYFGGMYTRYLWYPRVGFESVYFRSRLDSQEIPDCPGVFPGSCDAPVAQWIGDSLARVPSPLFIYWMTLNSHLPVPSSLTGLNPVPCDFDPLAQRKEPLCAWFKLEYQVHSSVARLASRTDIPLTVFVIVGDHAPPFTSPDIRNRFANDRVPFLLLIPDRLTTAGQAALTIASSPRQKSRSASNARLRAALPNSWALYRKGRPEKDSR